MTSGAGIRLEVVEADALAIEADALVLKYAQALYGADARAARVSGLNVSALPRPGGYHRVSAPAGIAARTLLMLGTVPLRQFDYAAIRDFGRRALGAIASEVPDARVIVMTIHGVGFGLDEVESFDSQLAGILDAIRKRDVPRPLERVIIAELSSGRAARMQERLRTVLQGATPVIATGAAGADVLERNSVERFERVGFGSSDREHAFVAMPFSESFEDLFHYGIANAVRSVGLLCERIDQKAFTGDVLERLKQQIESARIVVADLSDSNPNVFLEVGYAWGCRVPTVLLSRKECDVKFDVRGQRLLRYSHIKDAEQKLANELQALLA